MVFGDGSTVSVKTAMAYLKPGSKKSRPTSLWRLIKTWSSRWVSNVNGLVDSAFNSCLFLRAIAHTTPESRSGRWHRSEICKRILQIATLSQGEDRIYSRAYCKAVVFVDRLLA